MKKFGNFERFGAFTLAEMMVVMLIMSIILAAMAPVMTSRSGTTKDSSSPWRYAENNYDAYYSSGVKADNVAMIGQAKEEDSTRNSTLVINTNNENLISNHIKFRLGTSDLGYLRITSSSLLLGKMLSSGTLGENSVGIGVGSNNSEINISGKKSVAVGVQSSASYTNSTVLGYDASSFGEYGTALGAISKSAKKGVAVGNSAKSIGEASVAIGNNVESGTQPSTGSATGTGSIAIGDSAKTVNNFAIAIGKNAFSNGTDSISIGQNANNTVSDLNLVASQDNEVIAIGKNSHAYNSGAISLGINSQAGEYIVNNPPYNAIAIGKNASAIGQNSIALGNDAVTYATNQTAVGQSSKAAGYYATSIGSNAGSNVTNAGSSNILINSSGAPNIGHYNIGIGSGAFQNRLRIGSGNIALGSEALSSSNSDSTVKSYNIAIGYNSCLNVTGSNKICIGANSNPQDTAHAADNSERIYIGGKSNFNNAGSVLEVHNPSTSDTGGTFEIWGGRATYKLPSAGVVINGSLIVKGPFIHAGVSDAGNAVWSAPDSPGYYSTLEEQSGSGGSASVVGAWGGDGQRWKNHPIWNSDRRLKYVGAENKSGLDKIRQLKIFNYTFKKDETKEPHVGVIAQDLQKVFPNAVKKAADGFLKIRFEDMFYAMINAIKELDAKVTALEKENQEIKASLKQLQNDNKKLEKRIEKLERK